MFRVGTCRLSALKTKKKGWERERRAREVGTAVPDHLVKIHALRLDENSKSVVNCSPVDEVPSTYSGGSPKRAQEAAPAQLREEEPAHDDTHGRHPRTKRGAESLVRIQEGRKVGKNKVRNKHGTDQGNVHWFGSSFRFQGG